MLARSDDRRTLALLVVLAIILLAGCVDYPPGHYACLTCERGIEAAAEDEYDVSVTGSELRIRVREDGSARWTIWSTLEGADIETLRSDPEALDRFAAASVTDSVGNVAEDYAIHRGDVENVTARMDGETIIITFIVPDVADRNSGGIVLVDYFNTRGNAPESYSLGTDRIRLHGPSGTVVTKGPPAGTRTDDDAAVVWTDEREGISGTTYVGFGPDRNAMTKAKTEASVAADMAGWVVPGTLQIAILPALVTFFLVYVLWFFHRHRSDAKTTTADDRRLRPPRSELLTDGTILAAGIAGLLAITYTGIGTRAVDLGLQLLVWPPVVPFALLGLFGYTIGRFGRLSRLCAYTIVGWPIVLGAGFASTPPGPPSADRLWLLVLTLIFVLVGLPGFYAGYRCR